MPGSGKSTGQMVGMIAGLVVGAVLAAPTGGMSLYAGAMLGASIGGLAGGLVGGIYDSVNPSETLTEQESIADILFQTSTYGQPLIQIAGRFRVAGNIIDIGPKTEHEHREEERSGGGGKGMGGAQRQVSITKTYSVSLHIALADTRVLGPIAGIARAWADNTIIYDNTQSEDLPEGWTFYTGVSPEDPDPTFEAIHGVGNEPGYPYTCRLVIEDYDMGNNPRVPNFNFELYQAGAGSTPMTQLLVDPVDGDVWVAVPSLNQVWRYDAATRERLAVVQLSTAAPYAVSYGFSLVWQAAGYLWVGDPIAYRFWRIDPATNLASFSVDSNTSLLGNQAESNGYLWVPTLQYGQEGTAESALALLLAYNASGIAAFVYDQDFLAVNAWMKLTVGDDGDLWTFSDAADDESGVVRIGQTDGEQDAFINVGVGKRLYDILTGADGDLWVCNYTDGTILRIDPGTDTLSATVTTGAQPVQAGLASDGYIWVASRDRVVTRINPADNSTQSFQSDMPNVISPNNQIWAQAPAGAMWLLCTDDWTAQRFSTTGATLTVRTAPQPRSCAAGAGNTVWLVCASGDLQQVTDGGVITSASTTSGLATVVGLLTEAAGLEAADYDTTGLPGGQVILAITTIAAVRAPLEQLAQAYNFQLIESNRQLVYKLRGRAATVVDIPESDLDAASGGEATPGLAITRSQEAELATTLSLNYVSPTRNYQTNTQMAFVSNSRAPTKNSRVVSTNVGLSDLEAKQRAQELLDQLWVERNAYAVRVGRKYAYLEPMDRIRMTSRGVQHTLTISEANYGRPGLLEIQGRSDSAATQYVLGAKPGVVHPGGGAIPSLAHTVARLLNLPALDANDRAVRYHVAYQGQDGGWPGATLYRSVDDGVSYALLHGAALQGLVGTALTALADADALFTDTVSTVEVYLPHGSLASVSDAVFAGGGGILALLGDELVYAQNATLVDTDTYELGTFYRGRRGTEHQTGTHATEELFVLLDAGVFALPMALGERHVERQYKAVTSGLLISTVTAQDFTPTGSNLVLWSLFPAAEQSGADWVFTWYGRARFTGAWISGSEATPDPDFLHYRLEVYSDGTYVTVLRTVDQAQGADYQVAQTLTYSSAQQTSDFGSPQATVYYRLFAVGSYGAGDARDLVAS